MRLLTQRSGRLPAAHEFYRRVLDNLPSAVIVLDETGAITYGNHAMVKLAGWTIDEGVGTNIFGYLHPDDADWIAHAFSNFTTSPDAHQEVGTTDWSGLRFRILAKDGRVIPIEATGGGGLFNPAINGVMYSVRAATEEYLLDDILSGVANGDSVGALMQYIVELVTTPPLRIEAAVIEQKADGTQQLIVSTNAALSALPATCTHDVPWTGLATLPQRVEVEQLDPAVSNHLSTAGFRDIFHCGAHAPDVSTTLRLVAAAPDRHIPAEGPLQRMARARRLMSMVLLKNHNDGMLAEAASRDDLTGLPNRIGLNFRFKRLTHHDEYAVLFVDVDRLKRINDQHGHGVGDRVLATVADRLQRSVRSDDIVARTGGDEFVIVLAKPADHLDDTLVRRFAQRTLDMLAEPISINNELFHVSASVGSARSTAADTHLDDVIRRADASMYRAKDEGGGRHVAWQDDETTPTVVADPVAPATP